MKNPLTPAGIEPATFRFVAQHLNHCATAVLHLCIKDLIIAKKMEDIKIIMSEQAKANYGHKYVTKRSKNESSH